MTVILIRTLLIYLFLMLVMRLMGKRQLGELQVSELISTLVLSEVAATPIVDPNIPLFYALLPIGVIFSIEVILPELFFLFPTLRKWIEGSPCFLIQNGKICQKELRRNRITPTEFLASLRSGGIADPADVDYAILETSGTISIFRHVAEEPPTASLLHLEASDSGIAHILVSDGKLNHSALVGLGMTEADVYAYLRRYHRPLRDVFLLTRDDGGSYQLIWREPS